MQDIQVKVKVSNNQIGGELIAAVPLSLEMKEGGGTYSLSTSTGY